MIVWEIDKNVIMYIWLLTNKYPILYCLFWILQMQFSISGGQTNLVRDIVFTIWMVLNIVRAFFLTIEYM